MKNTLIKVLSLLMALTMIVGVFSAITVSAADCSHTKGDQVGEPVPATCASIGYTLYKCSKCGTIYPDDVVPMSKDHTGIVEVPASDATCLFPAMTAYSYCEDCMVDADGYPTDYIVEPEFVKDSKALGHNFVGSDNGATKCELATVYTCTRCNLTAEEAQKQADAYEIDADYSEYFTINNVLGTGHVWEYAVKTAPQTCVDGVMAGECTKCGATCEVAITATHKFDKAFLSCEDYIGYKCSICGVAAPNVVPNPDPEHNLAANPTRALNSTLEGMGYTAATIYKAATCVADGYAVYQCLDCKAYIQVTLYAEGHDFTGELLFKANEGTYPCGGTNNAGGVYYYACQNTDCEEILVLDTKADKGHLLKTTVVEPTCTAEGYTLVECLVCDYETRSNYTSVIDHELGDYIYSYDIEEGIDHTTDYTRHQKCENCTYTTEPEVIIAKTADGNHVLSTSTTLAPATCKEPAYQVYACKVEGCTYFVTMDADEEKDGVQKSYVGDVNKNNHDESVLTDLGVYEKATCAKAGWIKMYCTNCDVEVTVTVPMTAHKYGNTYDANGNGRFTDAGDKNWVAVAATCLTTGKTAGICCTGCGLTIVSPQITPTDPSNHKDSAGKVVAGVTTKTVGANCQNYGYTTKYYSCCNKYITTYVEDGELVLTNHVNTTDHKYVAPTCGNVGSHGYTICNDCGTIVNYDVCTCGNSHAGIETPVIKGLDHSFVTVNAKYESCDEIGWTAHKVCTKCGATEGKTVIPAHGKQYQTKIKAVAPTCTTIGYVSSGDAKVCTKCEIEYVEVSDWVIPALGHGEYVMTQTAGNDTLDDETDDVWEAVWVKGYVETEVTDDDCTTASGKVYTCPTCGYAYSVAADFVAAPNKEHTYNVVWHAYTVKNNKVLLDEVDTGYMACEHSTYEYRNCTTPGCDNVEKRNEVPAINHYTTQDGTKKDILLDCQNIAASVGYTCDLCHLSVTTTTEPTHKAAYAQKDATCTEDGYELLVCADCGTFLPNEYDEIVNTVEKAFGHDPYEIEKTIYRNQGVIANSIYPVNTSVDYVVEAKAPTASADGYITYRCKTCEEIVTVVVPAIKGLGFTVTTDDVLVNNTTVTVKIAVDANKFAFNSFKLDLDYDVYALEYVGAKLVYDGFAAADAVTLVAKANTWTDDYKYGYVIMNVYVPNGINGQPKNVELTADGAAFIEVTFKVRPTACVYIPEDSDPIPAIYDVYSYDYMIVDEDGELVDMNDVSYDIEADVDYDALVVNYAGDVNGDVMIDQGDAVAIMSLIYANEYSAAADVNRDGVVDLLDLGAVLQFTVSDYSMLEYLDMIGVSIDDVVANYKLRYDLNGDEKINDTDKALLADIIVETLTESEIPYFAMSEGLVDGDCVSLEDLVAFFAIMLSYNGNIA